MSTHDGDSIAPGVTNSPTHESPTQSASGYGEYTKEALEGWPALAQLMANTPEFAAFSRFRDLNIKSLLYYQAELAKLREELHEIEWRDHREIELSGAPDLSKNLEHLLMTKNEEDERARMQYEKVAEIRMVLKEYNEALLRFSQISALPDPENQNMKTLTYWLKDPSLGNHNVTGPGYDTWGSLSAGEIEPSLSKQFFNLLKTLVRPTRQKCDLDLVVTDPQRKVDRLTNWVATAYIPFYFALVRRFQRRKYRLPADEEAQRENQARSKDKKAPFDRSTFQKQTIETLPVLVVASSLSMLVTCLLPTIAIVVLAQLQHLRDLLICLASFTAGFAIIIPYLTRDEPTKMEVFLASAAFSAVLVVFIPIRLS